MCGYNLRALATPRCPECGESLRLSVSVVEPRLGPWIAAHGSVTIEAAVALIVTIIILFQTLR